ncbi:MAG: DUF1801 domain-containing protein [Chitinophagaceae bacterium]|nr:DUF1801 domain-containing protein [Chitinophagaceae bacterium]
MAELKTQKTKESVSKFITAIGDEEKRKDCKTLLTLFTETSGEKAAMWGDSIIGFGDYQYQSEKTRRGGDWFFGGFSPRKQALTIYLMAGVKNYPQYLKNLGKHKLSGGSCLYINRLSDIDINVLKLLIKDSFADMKAKHG